MMKKLKIDEKLKIDDIEFEEHEMYVADDCFPIKKKTWKGHLRCLWWKIQWRASDFKWWFMHRLHPGHRYHMVNTGLPYGYHDLEDRLTGAVFNLVCDFYETQADIVEWDDTYRHKQTYAVMEEAHEYWRGGGRAALLKRIDDHVYVESDGWINEERDMKRMDQEHIHKIVEYMHYMWS